MAIVTMGTLIALSHFLTDGNILAGQLFLLGIGILFLTMLFGKAIWAVAGVAAVMGMCLTVIVMILRVLYVWGQW